MVSETLDHIQFPILFGKTSGEKKALKLNKQIDAAASRLLLTGFA